MPAAGEKRIRRSSPESTTSVTPSMVRLLSATLVASTTLRLPEGVGASAASCSAGESEPCSGRISAAAGNADSSIAATS